MRGLACVLMFQTHCYDSWLSPGARQSKFFMYSQLGGTFPAPLFLFLAGISFALVTEKLWKKNLPPAQIARATIRRGAEIFGFGLLFRLQEYLIAWGWAPLSDLLRVDVLNTIGLSMMLMGVVCWLGVVDSARRARPGSRSLSASAGTALLISLLTPPLWTTWRPNWLPWPLESYINGVHNLGTPQAWLFPIFPWTAFAFAGLATGFILQSEWARQRETSIFLLAGATGLAVCSSRALARCPAASALRDLRLLAHQPELLFDSCGHAARDSDGELCLVPLGYRTTACGQWGFSPLIQLGQASLLVYWVHLEFVYGRVSILPKHSQSIRTRIAGIADDLPRHADPCVPADAAEGARG